MAASGLSDLPDDDDDDDDVDLSNYDVGTIDEPPCPEPPPPPPPPPLPHIGQTVMAKYSRRWEPAIVVAIDSATRVLDVRFIGFHDVVRVGESRWEAKASSRPHEEAYSSNKRERPMLSEDDLSTAEREMLARCVAARSERDDDGDAPIPGAPLGESSIGHKLLRKMGWRPGEGLGSAGNQGSVVPVSETLKVQDGRGGLRTAHERAPRR